MTSALATLVVKELAAHAFSTSSEPIRCINQDLQALILQLDGQVAAGLPIATTVQLYGGSGIAGIANVVSMGPGLQIVGEVLSVIPGQIPGTATNDDAGAGNVGETIVNDVAPNSVTVTSGGATAVAAITLTAGDWDVSATLQFFANGATCIATQLECFIGPNSTSSPSGVGNFGGLSSTAGYTMAADDQYGIAIPGIRYPLAGTTTLTLLSLCTFTSAGGNIKAGGYLQARRRR